MHNRALHSKQHSARSCVGRQIWGFRNLIWTLHSAQCVACTIGTSDWFSIVAKSLWMIVKEGRVYCILSKADLQTYWLGWPLPRSFLLCKKSQIIVHGMWAAVQKYPDLMPIRSDPQLFLPILQHFIAFPGLCTRAPYLGGEEGWICFPQQPPTPPPPRPNPTRAKMDVCPIPNRCYHPPPHWQMCPKNLRTYC